MTTSTKKQANFFISTITLNDLKAHIPSRKQSEFVEEAIQKELQQRKFFSALETSSGSWKKEDHPLPTDRFIRSLRESKRS